jgi:enoyl-CoA hydratase
MLHVEDRGTVSILRMRHGKANALDVEFCDALTAQLEELRRTPTRAIVLTSEGRIFSAGVDLLRILNAGPEYPAIFLPALSRVFETLFSHPKPVVAAINGHAIAGGCVLACAADHRLMARDAGRIGVPELLVGVPFPISAVEIMRFTAAPEHLQTLLYGGQTLSPEDAAERGLVSAVVEPAMLLDEAVQTAEALAALPPSAFTLTKHQLRAPATQRMKEGAHFDSTVKAEWACAHTRASIQDYVARTFRSPKM